MAIAGARGTSRSLVSGERAATSCRRSLFAGQGEGQQEGGRGRGGTSRSLGLPADPVPEERAEGQGYPAQPVKANPRPSTRYEGHTITRIRAGVTIFFLIYFPPPLVQGKPGFRQGATPTFTHFSLTTGCRSDLASPLRSRAYSMLPQTPGGDPLRWRCRRRQARRRLAAAARSQVGLRAPVSQENAGIYREIKFLFGTPATAVPYIRAGSDQGSVVVSPSKLVRQDSPTIVRRQLLQHLEELQLFRG